VKTDNRELVVSVSCL